MWVPHAVTLHVSATCRHSAYECHLPSLCIWVPHAVTLHMSATCRHSAYECHMPSLCMWVPPAVTHRFTISSPAKHHGQGRRCRDLLWLSYRTNHCILNAICNSFLYVFFINLYELCLLFLLFALNKHYSLWPSIIIIVIIIIKKGLQCKAEREWYSPYQSGIIRTYNVLK